MSPKKSQRNQSRSDSYIVRLHRHHDAAGETLVGLVEDPEREQQWSFRSLAEFMAIFVGLAAQQCTSDRAPRAGHPKIAGGDTS